MADDFREGTLQLADEDFNDELKGIVIDEDLSHIQRLWIGGATAMIVLILGMSWGYFYSQQTPEKIAHEKLQSRQFIAAQLAQSARILRLPHASTQQMWEALENVVFVSGTQLRTSESSQAPYIPERQLAMIEALEALLRMEIEGIVHPENKRDQELLDQLLFQLGLLELEYFDRGSLQRIPLSQAALYKFTLRKEQRNLGDYASASVVLSDLEAHLQQALEHESGTIVGYALLLGKWFRYHNDINNAQRCFEIGRKYVEGYNRADTYFPGKRPSKLCPLWTEYVSCLDALTEKSVKEKDYREARSYVARMFNTPQYTSPTSHSSHPMLQRRSQANKIAQLTNDIKVLETALQAPLDLPSFPFYSADDKNVHYDLLARQLIKAGKEHGNTPAYLCWTNLSSKTRGALKEWEGQGSALPANLTSDLLRCLNLMVKDHAFALQVDPLPKGLVSSTTELYERLGEGGISEGDVRRLNRNILDLSFDGAIDSPLVFSNGSYLHNSLDATQKAQLLAYYEDIIGLATTPTDRKDELRTRIGHIMQGLYSPRLRDLQEALTDLSQAIKADLLRADQLAAQQQKTLDEIQADLQKMDSAEGLDLQALSDLHDKEERARRRMTLALADKQSLEKESETLDDALLDIETPMRDRLYALQAELDMWEMDPSEESLAGSADSTSMITYLDQQIKLKQSYLELLESVHQAGQGDEIAQMGVRHKELSRKVEELRGQARQAVGVDREALLAELDRLQVEQYELVNHFDRILNPLQSSIEAISEGEKTIKEALDELRQTRVEIVKITGTDQVLGSLEDKIRKRAELILAQATEDRPKDKLDLQLRSL
ncbi:MAG: hypothetical protein KDK78_03650, partial [Chlamydiia bacterium]|nr:hypothetical protein [Chlamydiia bacterium]